MTYQTGTALHIDDMLGKLSVFAQAAGWTENKIVAGNGNGASSELYLSKGSSFFSFEAQLSVGSNVFHSVQQQLDHPFLDVHGSTGFDGGQPANGQPGTHSEEVETNWLLPNMTAFHFFTDPTKTYLHVVIETLANEFRHFHVGLMDKLGAYDGGEYVCGTRHDQAQQFIDEPMNFQHGWPWTLIGNSVGSRQWIRVNADGFQWKRTQSLNTQTWFPPMQGSAQGYPLEDFLEVKSNGSLAAQPNSFNSTLILFQMPAHIFRSSTLTTPVGKPHDLRMCNMKNIAPSTLVVFGGDEWLVFPYVVKKDPGLRDNLPNSAFLAFAYKKIP